MKVLIKKHIKSEADLPEEEGNYITDLENNTPFVLHNSECNEVWLNSFDWYLEEVELADLIELPTEDEIFTRAGEYEKEASYGLAAAYVNDDFCQGAKWAIEQIKNRIRYENKNH